MDNDDAQVGQLLTRREVLSLFGAAGLALVAAACTDSGPATSQSPSATSTAAGAATRGLTSTPTTASGSAATGTAAASGTAAATASTAVLAVPACVVRPALTEGPYFVDEKLNRSDIRAEPSTGAVKEGAPLTLVFNVSTLSGGACTALAGAMVDVWQCDALGVYSDAQDPGFNTRGQKFLRGYQLTDAVGKAQFLTVYPGWYQGRTVHIHFKIRANSPSGRASEFTSQLFFDDALTDQVHALAPYNTKGKRTLRNNGDGIFQQSGGQLTLATTPSGDGYAATFDIGLQWT